MGDGEVYAKCVYAVEGALSPPTSRSSVGAGMVVFLDALVLYCWPWPRACPTWYARALSSMMWWWLCAASRDENGRRRIQSAQRDWSYHGVGGHILLFFKGQMEFTQPLVWGEEEITVHDDIL